MDGADINLDKWARFLRSSVIMKTQPRLLIIPLTICCFALLPGAKAVNPVPDGCYPGFTTAEGCNALKLLTTGVANTGVGWHSLFSNTGGNYNTALGAGALVLNNGDSNTAVGTLALFLNTSGTQNTAVGTLALLNNDTASYNTAVGYIALQSNTTGEVNSALGWGALHSNTTGTQNTAVGVNSLGANNSDGNTAVGYHALYLSTTGFVNNGFGYRSLFNNVTGSYNNAFGASALYNNTGDANTAIGHYAGINLTTGTGNVCIGFDVEGVAGESNTTRIRNVYDSVEADRQVYVDSLGKLGTIVSSRRYKEEIKPMDKASEALFALKPVVFRYKQEIDPSRRLSFGLIAEDVAQVSGDLVSPDKEGKPQTVRYEAVNAMLLNEFLNEHKAFVEEKHKVEKLENTVAGLLATVKEQAVQIQKVSAQLQLSQPKAQLAAHKP